MPETIEFLEQVDTPRLVQDIKKLSVEARALKCRLRQRWTEPMDEVQRSLHQLKWRITKLCILRAFQRGRYHLREPLRDGAYPGMKWDRDGFHERIAYEVAQDYPRLKKAS